MEYCRAASIPAALAVVLLASALPVSARNTTFNPSLSVGFGYTDDVDYVGDGERTNSDTAISAGLTLPVRRDLANGYLRAVYDLDFRQYNDTGALDDPRHLFDFTLERSSRKDARLELIARYIQTVDQFGPPGLPNDIIADESDPTATDPSDLTVSERVDRQSLSATLNYSWRAGQRWRLSTGAGLSTSKYEQIRDFDGAEPGTDVENRDGIGVSLGAGRSSRRTEFGFAYRYQLIQLDTGGDEDFHRLDVSLDRDVSRRIRLEFEVGGFQRKPENPADEETRITGSVGIGFNEGLVLGPVRVGFGFGLGPSAGGALSGTSLNTSAGVDFSGVRVEPWNWRSFLQYNRREPFDDTSEVTKTGSAGASVERRISQAFGVRFGATWLDQSSDDPALEGSYAQVGGSLVWYPLGGTRLAGR